MSKKNILIAGATGYLGSHVTSYLRKKKFRIIILSHRNIKYRASNDIFSLSPETYEDSVERVSRIINKETIVINLAGSSNLSPSFRDVREVYLANYQFMFTLIDFMKDLNLNHYISTGSYWQYYQSGIFRYPNAYVRSKNFTTMTLRDLSGPNLKVRELVIYDSYGIDDTRPKLLNKISKLSGNDGIALTDGEQEICFVHSLDIARAFYLCCLDIVDVPDAQYFQTIPIVSNDIRSLREYIEDFVHYHPSPPKLRWGVLDPGKQRLMKIHRSNLAGKLLGWNAQQNFSNSAKMFFYD